MLVTAEHLATTLLALRGETSCEEELRDLIEAAIRYARIRVDAQGSTQVRRRR